MADPEERIRLVVGLGNPGPRYRGTRHNLGFDVLEALASRHALVFARRFDGRAAQLPGARGQVTLLMPQTFMNDSGRSVAAARRRLGVGPAAVLVVHDDLDLSVGAVRVRPRGSSGGHNGLRSIIAALGGEAFGRIRLGIGRPAGLGGDDVIRYVLERFPVSERALVDAAVERAADAVQCVVEAGYETAMNRFNGPPAPEPPARPRSPEASLGGPSTE